MENGTVVGNLARAASGLPFRFQHTKASFVKAQVCRSRKVIAKEFDNAPWSVPVEQSHEVLCRFTNSPFATREEFILISCECTFAISGVREQDSCQLWAIFALRGSRLSSTLGCLTTAALLPAVDGMKPVWLLTWIA